MSGQLFKKKIPNDLLIELLNQICIKEQNTLTKNELKDNIDNLNVSNHYIINNESYKRGLLNNTIINFIQSCKLYYHKSKLIYLERKLTYKSFITIIRQICNANNIRYTSQIKYQGSAYDIIYCIYIT
jgi:glutathionyl-hydroquinone reductase